MTATARITATGIFTPPESISNAELVASYNAWVDQYNAAHPDKEPIAHSSPEFIEKASGIKSRYVLDKSGILDITRMAPRLPARANNDVSIMAEIGVFAARDALQKRGVDPKDVDAVICAAANMQRGYPAMAIEMQHALGCGGFAYDMNVACASAAFGIQNAAGLINAGAERVLVISPEICSAHVNFCDRDGHFIFGDVATAVLIERATEHAPRNSFDILSTKARTQFSNNIRNNFGFINHAEDSNDMYHPFTDKLFKQNGRKVFKEVVPMVSALIERHLAENHLTGGALKRLWLHQANINMNMLIAKKILGREPMPQDAPTILDEYANTSSAGSIIAFHKYHQDLSPGDSGIICGFGAGYSAGSVIIRKVS